MNLMGDPDVFDIEILFECVDNSRADIAEGSDEVGKNGDGDCHVHSLFDLIRS